MTLWNPSLYQSRHDFVYQYGQDVVQWLEPKAGERILDLGCGTGQLTTRIADSGAEVIGLDSSREMIEEARRLYPSLRFEVADAAEFTLEQPVDAVFSNAALHWMTRAGEVAGRIHAALKPGGRFVAELGGHGNVAHLIASIDAGLRRIGITDVDVSANWYFPTVAQYATVLESVGFRVLLMRHFDRPTPLKGNAGLREWIHMFGEKFLHRVPADRLETFYQGAEEYARPLLYHDGQWWADYVRLRLRATRD